MDNAIYATLTRQSGLMREMQLIANNIANAATTGYRQEGLVFSEFIRRIDGGESLSMATATVRDTSMLQGSMTQTGGNLDLAIDGDGFFLVETAQGQRLTRAGHFMVSAAGDLVTPAGHMVLDAGGAAIFVPPDAVDLSVSGDGTISTGGQPLGQIGVVLPADPVALTRETGTLFRSEQGTVPSDTGRVLQGFLESSNVDPVGQIARMIQVQRAYEMGQALLEREDERIRTAIKTFIR
jgi:flagellar basal-body rod protein FlgF